MSVQSSALTFNELLGRSGIDPGEVVVFRHRPWEPELNKALEWIVAERRELFDCYQDSHGPKTEAALLKARYAASFIRYGTGNALFVGFYERLGQTVMSDAEYRDRPLHRELIKLGMSGNFSVKDGRTSVVVFDLRPTAWHSELHGRLIISWPGLERSWYRWADRNSFDVTAIAQDSLFESALPRWDDISLTWAQLGVIPMRWRSAIAQWRGVYLITDKSDNRSYVGSASGAENILQRWLEYGRTGHGGNKHLKACKPENLTFCILQLVAQDSTSEEVVQFEQRWKRRLSTLHPLGLNAN